MDFGGTTSVGWPDVGRQTSTWAEFANRFKAKRLLNKRNEIYWRTSRWIQSTGWNWQILLIYRRLLRRWIWHEGWSTASLPFWINSDVNNFFPFNCTQNVYILVFQKHPAFSHRRRKKFVLLLIPDPLQQAKQENVGSDKYALNVEFLHHWSEYPKES